MHALWRRETRMKINWHDPDLYSSLCLRNLEDNSRNPNRQQFERSCTYALENGVENSVRRSYGCSD